MKHIVNKYAQKRTRFQTFTFVYETLGGSSYHLQWERDQQNSCSIRYGGMTADHNLCSRLALFWLPRIPQTRTYDVYQIWGGNTSIFAHVHLLDFRFRNHHTPQSPLWSKITNRKSYMSFRLVPKSVTLNDLERRNGRYIALFHWIW